MYVAFIDESGKPTKKELTPFVLASLIIHDFQLNDLKRALNDVRLRHGLDPSTEFHARDIVHGKRGFEKISMEKRKSILDDLFNVLKSLDATLISVAIIKKYVVSSSEPDSSVRFRLESLAYELLVERLILFLEKQKRSEWMLLVIDETYSRHDINIRRNIERTVTQGFYASRWPASKRVFCQPLFAPSREYEGLQLADIVAYTVFKIYSDKPKSAIFDFKEYFEEIKDKFDKCKDGRIIGCGIKDYTV